VFEKIPLLAQHGILPPQPPRLLLCIRQPPIPREDIARGRPARSSSCWAHRRHRSGATSTSRPIWARLTPTFCRSRISRTASTLNSALLAQGKDVVKVKEAVGHSDLKTTMGYTHLAGNICGR
jgi:hypothetical protein